MDLKDVIEVLGDAEDLRPMFKMGVVTVMDYAAETKPLFDGFLEYMRSKTIDGIAYYQNHGCSREEAILLVIDQNHSLQEALKRNNTRKNNLGQKTT